MGFFSRKVVIVVPDGIHRSLVDSDGNVTFEKLSEEMARSRGVVESSYSFSNRAEHVEDLRHYERIYEKACEAHAKGWEVVIKSKR